MAIIAYSKTLCCKLVAITAVPPGPSTTFVTVTTLFKCAIVCASQTKLMDGLEMQPSRLLTYIPKISRVSLKHPRGAKSRAF